ncbi:MAG: D-alanine--D-alanine ligase [Deltaproteobacteria bacterium]|nr:D-alanine--D-alanine ligase [Deltaproteobacteria bacterium]
MKKLRLALIAGGKSAEREVSLKSGEQVFQALDKTKYDIRRYDPRDDLERLVREAPEIDAALVIMHGRGGEDGSLQGLLDLLDIPYQGSGILGSALGMNKELSKILYEHAGLKVPQAIFFNKAEAPSAQEIEARVGLPAVIKPVNEGSSIGVTFARTLEELDAGLKAAFAYDNRVLVEQCIKGTEVTGGVLGNDHLTALPLVEIVPSENYAFFDYEAKYKPGASTEICPARLNAALTKKAQASALAAHRALNCRGYSRTDMIVKDGEVYVLETNTIPGMTATSLFPQAAKTHGLEFPQLLDKLIELALEGRQRPVDK